MDVETLLTGVKWEIIEILAKKPSSPTELAEKLNTTVANISQQLRLLQTAGLTKRKRISQLKPGKPRTQFSLADDYALIISISPDFAKKKLIKLTPEQKKAVQKWLE
jgi:predicted transcriptional regulator